MTTPLILEGYKSKLVESYSSSQKWTKELVETVPLSLVAIEKRKKMMKEDFEVENGGDLALINAARKMGFI